MIKYIPETGENNLIKQSHSSHGRQERASRAGLLSHGVRGSATVPPRPPRALAEEADAWAPVVPPRRSQRSTAAPRHCDPPPRAPRREVRQLDYLPHPFASQAGCARDPWKCGLGIRCHCHGKGREDSAQGSEKRGVGGGLLANVVGPTAPLTLQGRSGLRVAAFSLGVFSLRTPPRAGPCSDTPCLAGGEAGIRAAHCPAPCPPPHPPHRTHRAH